MIQVAYSRVDDGGCCGCCVVGEGEAVAAAEVIRAGDMVTQARPRISKYTSCILLQKLYG